MRTLKRLIVFFLIVAALSSRVNTSAQRQQLDSAGITVFTERNFNGRSATYREEVPDLELLGMNDRISSLRVGRGERWEICERSHYQGCCVVVLGNEHDLRRNSWNNLISSMRRVNGGRLPPSGPPSANDYIVIFDRTNYRGRRTNYNGPNPSIPKRGQSVIIGSGVWELCECQNYSGGCITLDRSVPNLGTYNMRNRVISVRLVGSGGSVPPAAPGDWDIVVYDRTSYRGSPTSYPGPASYLFKPARSVTIASGTWQFCQGKNFTGRCVMLSRSAPDLRAFNIRQVGSLRPIIRQPR